MKIINANVFHEEGFFQPGEIEIAGGVFVKTPSDGSGAKKSASFSGDNGKTAVDRETVYDARGCYAIPGLIDIHLHGCVGGNFYEADVNELVKMLRYQAQNGVTAVCPTTLTLPEEALARACAAISAAAGLVARSSPQLPDETGPAAGSSAKASGSTGSVTKSSADDTGAVEPAASSLGSSSDAAYAAAPVGVYLEGPFISPQKCGAQNPAYAVPPDIGMVRRLISASDGLVKILALAPEIEGAMQLIKKLAGEVTISIAHTNADYAEAVAAFRRGASHVTHLYNAMSAFSHRAPNVIGAALDTPGVTAELVLDGLHLHPAAVRIAMRCLGPDRAVFISDSMMATGLGDGTYDLGGLSVKVTGREARLVEGGNIASSVSNLMDCLRVAVKEVGIPLADAVRCASVNPARVVGAQNERGRIAAGMAADLVILDEDLNIVKVFIRGRPADGGLN